MALWIYKNKNHFSGERAQSHIDPFEALDIIMIQVNDREAEYISKYMKNVPFNKEARLQTYYGDMARYILANERWEKFVREFEP